MYGVHSNLDGLNHMSGIVSKYRVPQGSHLGSCDFLEAHFPGLTMMYKIINNYFNSSLLHYITFIVSHIHIRGGILFYFQLARTNLGESYPIYGFNVLTIFCKRWIFYLLHLLILTWTSGTITRHLIDCST